MTLLRWMRSTDSNCAEIAAKLGVSKQTVWLWVVGKRIPRLGSMIKIFKMTNGAVRASDFYKGC